MKRITVLLADDNRIGRSEFRKTLGLEGDLEVIGEAKDGCQAVAMVNELHPALVLMNVALPLLNGLQVICQILKANPNTKVLILSTHCDEAYVVGAINSSAGGYLIKQIPAGKVCRAIRAVHQKKAFFSSAIPCRLHKRNQKSR